MVDYTGIPNLTQPQAQFAAGGQPSVEQLSKAAQTGLKRIINLRPPSEDAGFDEAAEARALGVEYHNLPVAGQADFNVGTVKALNALLESAPGETLVHCASGNRVGALMALRAAWLLNSSADAAIETGRQWGLTKLEPVVRQMLKG